MPINPELIKKLSFQLEKEDMDDFTARVGFITDVSGSMKSHYRSGLMKKLNECLLAVGIKFDDNREMDMKMFSGSSYDLPEMTEENFSDYIEENIIKSNKNIWGITNYAPPIRQFVKDWFDGCLEEKKQSIFGKLFGGSNKTYIPRAEQMPGFLIFQTDGSLHDNSDAKQILEFINKYLNMYVVFVCVGDQAEFDFVKEVSENLNNVDYIVFDGKSDIDEEELYSTIVSDKVHKFFSENKE